MDERESTSTGEQADSNTRLWEAAAFKMGDTSAYSLQAEGKEPSVKWEAKDEKRNKDKSLWLKRSMKEAPKIPEGEKMGLRTQPEGYTVEEEGYFSSEKRKKGDKGGNW